MGGARRIMILTGAGISAESGLGTFRDREGIWSQFKLEEVATPTGYARNPTKVLEFYNLRRANSVNASPNAAHLALARLQREWPTTVSLVTQNIDDLHERAGSTGVIHMHGQVSRALCHQCGARWRAPLVMLSTDPCPTCHALSTRPDVVWFHEVPYYLDEIENLLSQAQLFVSIGTSGTVWPAAGYAAQAAKNRASTIEINLESSGSADFHEVRVGLASHSVPEWIEEMFSTLCTSTEG